MTPTGVYSYFALQTAALTRRRRSLLLRKSVQRSRRMLLLATCSLLAHFCVAKVSVASKSKSKSKKASKRRQEGEQAPARRRASAGRVWAPRAYERLFNQRLNTCFTPCERMLSESEHALAPKGRVRPLCGQEGWPPGAASAADLAGPRMARRKLTGPRCRRLLAFLLLLLLATLTFATQKCASSEQVASRSMRQARRASASLTPFLPAGLARQLAEGEFAQRSCTLLLRKSERLRRVSAWSALLSTAKLCVAKRAAPKA